MQKLRWIVGIVGLLSAAPTPSNAQAKEDAEDFTHDVLGAIFGSNWNVFGGGGFTTSGRYMLQTPGGGGQRALEGESSFNLAGGLGVDILAHTGFRASYTFTSSDLDFLTDNGDGSSALDIENVGKLQSHVVSFEIMRYMIHARAGITPYASAGFLASWWKLTKESAFVVSTGGATQFGFGALGTLGVQIALSSHLTTRLEATSATLRNPFTGGESYTALGGATIEEPTRVGHTDWRIVGVYYFNKPVLSK